MWSRGISPVSYVTTRLPEAQREGRTGSRCPSPGVCTTYSLYQLQSLRPLCPAEGAKDKESKSCHFI